MNIKFGMDNFIVRYLKRFINHELEMPTTLLGGFDKNDLKSSAINTSLLVIREILLPEVYFQPSASKNARKAHSNSDSQ